MTDQELTEVLWTIGLTENEERLLLKGGYEILDCPGSSGEIGVLQGTRDWFFDALDQYVFRGSEGPPPSMSSLLGQCIGGVYYWDKYIPEIATLSFFPAVHNRGPGGLKELKLTDEERPEILKLYLSRFLHFWKFRKTVFNGRVDKIAPYSVP